MSTGHQWATSENTNEISMRIVPVSEIPPENHRGRPGFIENSPFWKNLTEKLSQGLQPFESVEIELNPTETGSGKFVTSEQELATIRYEFTKTGLSKKYSLIVRGKTCHLYVVSHETAAAMDEIKASV